MKPHLALAAITLSAINFSSHAEEVWFALSPHAAVCVALPVLLDAKNPANGYYSFLNGARTPSELFDRLKARAPDAKIQPFIEIRQVDKKPHEPVDREFPDVSEFFKHFSKSNAYALSSKSLGFELGIFAMSLCQQLNLPIIRDVTPSFRTP